MRNQTMHCLLALMAVLAPALAMNAIARAAIIHVPGDHATIQAAVSAASPLDTILVADGTYTGTGNKNIVVNKVIEILSESDDPTACIIDCQDSGNGFTFGFGATDPPSPPSVPEPRTLLRGFTIKNGAINDRLGGGIESYAVMRIENCRILDCNVSGLDTQGGGIFIGHSHGQEKARVANCLISGNFAPTGGGVALGAHAAFRDCTILENIAPLDGAGVASLFGNADFIKCTISGNLAGDDPFTEYCGSGGGMYISIGALQTVKLVNCVLSHNDLANASTCLGGHGAGIRLISGSLQLTNCLINKNGVGNSLAGEAGYTNYGGGISNETGNVDAANCTIVGNGSWAAGGGIYQKAGLISASGNFKNCIIRNNSAPTGAQIAFPTGGSNTLQLRYSNLQGGQSGISGGTPSVYDNMIDADPHFADPSSGDYRLLCPSLSINSGSASLLRLDEFDVNNNSNITEYTPDLLLMKRDEPTDAPDMGAYETLIPEFCPGDTNGDAEVDVNDLLAVINGWGTCPSAPAVCPGDVTPRTPCGNGLVNVDDLLAIINNWGDCFTGSGSFPSSVSACFNDYCNGLTGVEYQDCTTKCVNSYCSQTPTPDDCE